MVAARVEFEGFGGLRLAGDSYGSEENPAVLMLPSMGQSRAYWRHAASALAEAGRHAVCIDLRGQGDSDHASDGRYDLDAHVNDLVAVLGALPSRAVVVANGFSALVALAALGEASTPLASGLVLVDSTIWLDEAGCAGLQGALRQRAGSFASREEVIATVAAAYPGEPAPEDVEAMLAGYERGADGRYHWSGDPRAFMVADVIAAQDRLASAAARLAIPVQLVRGAQNATVSAEAQGRLRDLIPGAEAGEVEGTGHFVAADRADAFNALLLEFLERRVPRTPTRYIGGAEPRLLRDALGCFATGITVVTSWDEEGQPIGLTANSFTSLSLEPPLILFALANRSGSMDALLKAGRFAVNVLQIGQQPISGRFASRDAPRFDGIDWSVMAEGGSPILHGSLASFDCTTHAVHEGGDHTIFVGEVHHAWFEPHRDPLLYFRGRYRRLHLA